MRAAGTLAARARLGARARGRRGVGPRAGCAGGAPGERLRRKLRDRGMRGNGCGCCWGLSASAIADAKARVVERLARVVWECTDKVSFAEKARQ